MNRDEANLVSVIIPVYNDAERLKHCLQALQQQTYRQEHYEVIVIDNNSEEDIAAVVQNYSQVRVVKEPMRGSYAARNSGISHAQGEILAFTDADCIPDPTWIERGTECLLALDRPGLIAGEIKIFFKQPDQPTAPELYDSLTNLQQKKIAEQAHFAATANLFTFKQVFDEIGLFNPQLKSGGDSEWGKRAFSQGYPVVYATDACVAHPARDSMAQLYKKVARVRSGFYQLESVGQQQRQQSLLRQFLNVAYRWKPPLLYAFKRSFLEPRLKGYFKKLQIFAIVILVHYRGVYEVTKLMLKKISKQASYYVEDENLTYHSRKI
ncbi:MAG: glycosyltransferase [Microcoleaceae cyanobacterium]